MSRTGEPFESFREGMAAGHQAGESKDLLYAAGFLVGFLWAVVASGARRETRASERVTRVA